MKTFNLRFLTSNDVYKPSRFSVLKTMKSLHSSSPSVGTNVLSKIVFPGDFLGGSLFSVTHTGESMLHVCNEVGFDFVTLGNHEFDYGSERLEKLIDMSTFKWLGSNVRYSGNNELFHKVLDYDIISVPSEDDPNICLRVGIFGLCTQETPRLSSPTDAVKFDDVLEHGKRLIKYLKEVEKVNSIVCMSHVSLEYDKFLAELEGLDLILGGHDHEPFILEHSNTLIVKCGQDLEYLGIVDLKYHSKVSLTHNSYILSETTVSKSTQLLSTDGIQSDPKLDQIIKEWKSKGDSGNQGGSEINMDEVLTIVDPDSSHNLSTLSSDCRRIETSFPCILADSYEWYFKQQGFECDLAIQNGGFVRANMIYKPGTPITRAIVSEELPFTRNPVLIEMTGADICEALNQMLPSIPCSPPVGSFPQISSSLSAKYDLSFMAKNCKKVSNVCVKGTPIDLAQTYRVATTSFYVHECGDNVNSFHQKKIINQSELLCSDVMIMYLRTKDNISGVPPRRLVEIK